MEKKTKACPFCWEEILETAVKCKHCGEFLDGRGTQKEVVVQQPKKKKWLSWMEWALIIVVTLAFIWFFSTSDTAKNDVGNISRDYSTTTNTVKHYDNLNDAYNDHKNYIRNVCKEWLKLISSNQEHNFEWPTYAGEYQGKFILKWTDNGVLFRCEFVPYENEWGMNLNDVQREI